MSALSDKSTNSLISGLKSEIAVLIWDCYNDISGDSIKISILKIPISIKISNLDSLIEKLVGPRPAPNSNPT